MRKTLAFISNDEVEQAAYRDLRVLWGATLTDDDIKERVKAMPARERETLAASILGRAVAARMTLQVTDCTPVFPRISNDARSEVMKKPITISPDIGGK